METNELLKRVRQIEIKTRGLSSNIFAGQYHSAFKGRGMSFAEEAMDIVDVNEKGEVTSVTPSKKMPQRKPKAHTVVEQPNAETDERQRCGENPK